VKSVLVTVVRNESDIIESFVRYHVKVFEHIFVLDHLSKDGTSEILSSLKKEGLPLTVDNVDVPYHCQGQVITTLLKDVRNKYKPSVMMALDADEFLVGDIMAAAYILPKKEPATASAVWWNYAPTQLENFNPLKTITHRNIEINPQQHKVLVPGALFDFDVNFQEGCHELYCKNNFVPMVSNHHIYIAHMPIRSIEQFKKKALVGWISKLANPANNGLKPEWSHWKFFFDRIKKGNDIDLKELQNLALGYTSDHLSPDRKLQHDPVPSDGIDLKYSCDGNYQSFEALADAAEFLAYQFGLCCH
jgi:Glycosyl transferase family 2